MRDISVGGYGNSPCLPPAKAVGGCPHKDADHVVRSYVHKHT